MSYLSALAIVSKSRNYPESIMTYQEAFRITKQYPSINKYNCTSYETSYANAFRTGCPKKPTINDIPFKVKPSRKSKKTKKPTRIPKFLVFILLPFFTKQSNIYKVLLPESFVHNDFYACTVCHLVAKYWTSPGSLTMYNCYMQYGSWVFKTACCKKCAKLGNRLEACKH